MILFNQYLSQQLKPIFRYVTTTVAKPITIKQNHTDTEANITNQYYPNLTTGVAIITNQYYLNLTNTAVNITNPILAKPQYVANTINQSYPRLNRSKYKLNLINSFININNQLNTQVSSKAWPTLNFNSKSLN